MLHVWNILIIFQKYYIWYYTGICKLYNKYMFPYLESSDMKPATLQSTGGMLHMYTEVGGGDLIIAEIKFNKRF